MYFLYAPSSFKKKKKRIDVERKIDFFTLSCPSNNNVIVQREIRFRFVADTSFISNKPLWQYLETCRLPIMYCKKYLFSVL